MTIYFCDTKKVFTKKKKIFVTKKKCDKNIVKKKFLDNKCFWIKLNL